MLLTSCLASSLLLGLIRPNELKAILASKQLRFQIIKDETSELVKKFGDERRTEIQDAAEELTVGDYIAEEEMVITISHLGYVKRLSITGYRKQQRGGKGVIGIETKEEGMLVARAVEVHPVPFRTRKLSPRALMVLHWRRCGRVSRCQHHLLLGSTTLF